MTPHSMDGIHVSLRVLPQQSHKGMQRDPASHFCFPSHLLWCGLGKALMSLPLHHRRSCPREEAASSTCGRGGRGRGWGEAGIHSGSLEQCCLQPPRMWGCEANKTAQKINLIQEKIFQKPSGEAILLKFQGRRM